MDLALRDCFLFLRGTHFPLKEVIKAVCTGVSDAIDAKAFENCFQLWEARKDKSVRMEGEYIEGYQV